MDTERILGGANLPCMQRSSNTCPFVFTYVSCVSLRCPMCLCAQSCVVASVQVCILMCICKCGAGGFCVLVTNVNMCVCVHANMHEVCLIFSGCLFPARAGVLYWSLLISSSQQSSEASAVDIPHITDEETEAQGGYQVVQTSLVITETVFILYALLLIVGPRGLGMGPPASRTPGLAVGPTCGKTEPL